MGGGEEEAETAPFRNIFTLYFPNDAANAALPFPLTILRVVKFMDARAFRRLANGGLLASTPLTR